MKHWIQPVAASLLLAATSGQAQEIALGLLDNFNDQTTGGWRHGPVSPNPPIVVEDTGGDFVLQNLSNGLPPSRAPGDNHIIINSEPRWTGDYIAAGVNKLRVNIKNLTASGPPLVPVTLPIRAGLRSGINCWVSTTAAMVPPDGMFANYEFLLDPSTMSLAGGTASFEETLRNVDEIRFFVADNPACSGDNILAVTQWDDFQTTADSDLDGINDDADNCTLEPNPPVCIGIPTIDNAVACAEGGGLWGQIDSDGDLYGNACDADFSDGPFVGGDCAVDLSDLAIFRASFLTSEGGPNYNQVTDMRYDGMVDLQDLAQLRQRFLADVGPGLGGCSCPRTQSQLDPGADFDGRTMFVRGGFNGWGLAEVGINDAVNTGGEPPLYIARLQINPGTWAFKIASQDWSLGYANIDWQTGGNPTIVNNPAAIRFNVKGGVGTDAQITIDELGCYEFSFTPIPFDPPVPTTPWAEFIDVFVTGPLE